MKYANIIYLGGRSYNMGDVLMPLAINYIYQQMGIPSDEIIRIDYNNLGNYNGEPVLLPIVSSFIGYHDGTHITCYAPAIHPVFLSLRIMAETLNQDDIDYLCRHAPIGCRDHHTYEIMCKYNIPAYVNGCMTLTLQFSERESRSSKYVLAIDMPERLRTYIPDEYTKIMKEYSQIRESDDESRQDIEAVVYQSYLQYFRDAKLVITGRLHCALPCIMAGIPVIFVGEGYEDRYSWMDKYIPFYDVHEWDSIDWHPDVNKSLEKISAKMRQFAIERITYCKHLLEYQEEMTNNIFTKERPYTIAVLEKTMEKIDGQINTLLDSGKKTIIYGVWGVGQLSDLIIERMEKRGKGCIFIGMFDNKFEGSYRGEKVQKPDKIICMNMDLIIVTPSTIAGKEETELKKAFKNCNLKYVFIQDCVIAK